MGLGGGSGLERFVALADAGFGGSHQGEQVRVIGSEVGDKGRESTTAVVEGSQKTFDNLLSVANKPLKSFGNG